jgi:hypothetical protein
MAQISEIPVRMYFYKILSNITRPSFTAIKMVEKLSSSRTMSAASLEMAVPLIPIAILMLALLRGIIYTITGHRYKLVCLQCFLFFNFVQG